MQSISVIMKNEKSADLLNVNDLDAVVDIGLRELGNVHSARARVQTLRVLLLILNSEVWLDHQKEKRLPDFYRVFEEQIL